MINKQQTEEQASGRADNAQHTVSSSKATQVSLDLLLPSAPDQADACVHRLIAALARQPGIHQAHVIERSAYGPAKLCVHFNADSVQVEWVRELVRAVGVQLTSRYGHIVTHMQSDLHGQALRAVEERLLATIGVVEVAATANGVLRVEFDSRLLAESDLREVVADIELQTQGSRARGIPQLRTASAVRDASAGPLERPDEQALLAHQQRRSQERLGLRKLAHRLPGIQWSRWRRTLLIVIALALAAVLLNGCANSSATPVTEHIRGCLTQMYDDPSGIRPPRTGQNGSFIWQVLPDTAKAVSDPNHRFQIGNVHLTGLQAY
ncbi:hypothetical protein [Steroidobacter sp.]|uniref:hypothetical protein n=1 Tax=Steroidobacter sp. TaxID=1978227 RepID=UPI001A629987|nr:hypothetical protein [Steroidobacter sp.]MBL8270331.1 hypothetical protein [Steroidobacter sp.]